MRRHKQYKILDPSLVKQKLHEFFLEDNIDFDITTKSTQFKKKITSSLIAKENLIFVGKEIIIQAFQEE